MFGVLAIVVAFALLIVLGWLASPVVRNRGQAVPTTGEVENGLSEAQRREGRVSNVKCYVVVVNTWSCRLRFVDGRGSLARIVHEAVAAPMVGAAELSA